MELEKILKIAVDLENVIQIDKGISCRRTSVGQEKQLMQTLRLTVCSTLEEGGCWMKVGGGTVEI